MHYRLRKVVSLCEIYYDPDPRTTIIEEDADFVAAYYELPVEDVDPSRLSPWLLRIVLDRAKMLDKKLCMADVVGKISECFGADISCFALCSDDNSPQLVIRIRIVNEASSNGGGALGSKGFEDSEDSSCLNPDSKEEEDVFLRRLESHILDGIILKGIVGIKRVFIVV